MTQKEKNLLLKDLCGRLPSELWVQYEDKEYLATGYGHGRVSLLPSVFSSISGLCPLLEEVKLYLRSMSSMTEDEKEYVSQCIDIVTNENYGDGWSPSAWDAMGDFVNYCNERHLDFRGLIRKGLALEAPEGMYKTE